jgi:methylated-DNA-[protein]-cysteine S-methyltransferase
MITLATLDTPLGRFAIAATPRGLLRVTPAGRHAEPGREEIADASIASAIEALRAYAVGEPCPCRGAFDLRGTEFQLRVWERLLAIPFGGHVTYGQIAADLGVPAEARAVGSAVAANPIAVLIPCHRVVGAGGELRGYAWGLDLKRRLLEHEGGAPGAAQSPQLSLALLTATG